MKKNIILVILVFSTFTNFANAQVKDSFDGNTGWTEYADKEARAVIENGVLNLIGKFNGDNRKGKLSFVESTNYAPIDVTDDFEIKCEAVIKKISEDGAFGMMVDYFDSGNCIKFEIYRYEKFVYAVMLRYKDGELCGHKITNIKVTSKRDAVLPLAVKYINERIQFIVNGVTALELRHIPITSTGIGFYIEGQQNVTIDNLEYIQ